MIVFTHNDLDALGSEIILRSIFKVTKAFHTNYGDMESVVEQIIAYKNISGDDAIYIADVSFSDEKRQQYLEKICENFKEVHLADHHQMPDSLRQEEFFQKIDFHYTTEVCATSILFELYKNQIPSMKGLAELINAYDVWLVHDKLFDPSQSLNDYFWFKTEATRIENRHRISDLANEIISLGYKLPADYLEVVQKCSEIHKEEIKRVLENNLLQRYNAKYKTTVIISWDSFNEIMIKEMKEGADFVVGICNGIFKIRASQDTNFPSERLHLMRKFLTNNEEYGHEHAFTYKIEKGDKEHILEEIKKILTFINE